MKNRSFLHSLNEAADGFVYVIRRERNMRVHFLFAFFVLLSAIFVGVSRLEWMILTLATSLVLVSEMINTALEHTIDLAKPEYHPVARIIKHISAGAVLVMAVNALIVGFVIFSRYIGSPFEAAVNGIRYASWHLAFASVLVAIFVVVGGKAFFHRGTPFRGGAISGHSAVAFALWTALVYATSSPFAVGLGFCLALLVAQSRLRAKIHSFWEVVAGAAVGTSVTLVLFQFFR